MSNEAGVLYIVATPIGNLKDITLRALEVLQHVDLIAAEDTRHSRKLLNHYGIDTPQLSFHEHNEQAQAPRLLARLQNGASVALISDAGTPLISDPGYRLVSQARVAGITISPIPGPSAVIAALSAAGLPTDRFAFEGFLPPKAAARRKRLAALRREPRTLVLYASSHRVMDCLRDLSDCLGSERQAVLARELTKTFETFRSASLGALCQWLEADRDNQRGEFVLVIQGALERVARGSEEHLIRVVTTLMSELPLKPAVRLAAELTGEPRNKIYRLALSLTRA